MSVPKLAVLLKLRIVVDAGGRLPRLVGVGVDEAPGRLSNDDVAICGRLLSMLLLLLTMMFCCPAPLMLPPLPLREPPLGLSVGEALGTSLGEGMLVAATLETTGLAIPDVCFFF